MSMQDESIDPRIGFDFGVGIAKGGCLYGFPRVMSRRVKSLFTQDDASQNSTDLKVLSIQKIGQDLQVLEGDARRFAMMLCRLVFPEARLKQIFRIRMKGYMPGKVTFLQALFAKGLEKVTSRKSLVLLSRRKTDVPMMLERNVNPMLAGRFLHCSIGRAHRLRVRLDHFVHGSPTHVVPPPM